MPSLQETLVDSSKRKNIIQDCVLMIDEEVASKGGISGLAIKGSYRLVKGIKPGFIAETVDGLLDGFCKNLQPIVDDAKAKGEPVRSFFVANRTRVGNALLAVTDERAQKTRHNLIKSAYEKLRPSALRNVEDAVPRVGGVIEKYTRDSA